MNRTDKILVSRAGPVTTIILNRPRVKNCLDNEAAHTLADALYAFDADPDAFVAILTGAGGAGRGSPFCRRQRSARVV